MTEAFDAQHELLNELRMLRSDIRDLRRSADELTKALDRPAPQTVQMYPSYATTSVASGAYTGTYTYNVPGTTYNYTVPGYANYTFGGGGTVSELHAVDEAGDEEATEAAEPEAEESAEEEAEEKGEEA